MSGLKLLLAASEYPPGPGGIGTHAHQLAKHLHGAGYEIFVLASQDNVTPADARSFNSGLGWRVTSPGRTGPTRIATRWTQMRRMIRNVSPDVVIASGDRVVYTAVAQRSVPVLAVEHGRIPAGAERRLKRWAFERADRVIAVSNYSLKALLGYTKPRMASVITNGADDGVFRSLEESAVNVFRDRYSLPRRNIICTVGSVTGRKGQESVVRALPRIVRDSPDVLYVCAGLPVEASRLEALARELDVAEHVRFLGALSSDDLPVLYNATDVFVMTSRHDAGQFEGFGIAVIEAALCGKPSVVSASSGVAEAVEDGVTGILVPENDPEALTSALGRLLNDPDTASRMGASARERALARFTWSDVAAQYSATIDEMIEASRSR